MDFFKIVGIIKKSDIIYHCTGKQNNILWNISNFGIKPNDFSGFKRDKTEYSTEVPNNVTKVNVYATALDENAKVTGKTDDYADTLYDRTRRGEDHYTVETHHLKPGTTTVKGAGKIK